MGSPFPKHGWRNQSHREDVAPQRTDMITQTDNKRFFETGSGSAHSGPNRPVAIVMIGLLLNPQKNMGVPNVCYLPEEKWARPSITRAPNRNLTQPVEESLILGRSRTRTDERSGATRLSPDHSGVTDISDCGTDADIILDRHFTVLIKIGKDKAGRTCPQPIG